MFKMEFNTGNAAFCNEHTGEPDEASKAHEVERILNEVSRRITHQGYTEGSCFDVNGNKVGEWKLT